MAFSLNFVIAYPPDVLSHIKGKKLKNLLYGHKKTADKICSFFPVTGLFGFFCGFFGCGCLFCSSRSLLGRRSFFNGSGAQGQAFDGSRLQRRAYVAQSCHSRKLVNGVVPVLQAGVGRTTVVFPDVISSFFDSVFIKISHFVVSINQSSKIAIYQKV